MKKYNKTWSFPATIDMEMVALYLNKFEQNPRSRHISFDLSKTKYIHSSFLGFLIDARQKIIKEGGDLQLLISPEIEKILLKRNLGNYLPYTRARIPA